MAAKKAAGKRHNGSSRRRRTPRVHLGREADLVFAGFLLAVAFLALGFSTRVWEAQASFMQAAAGSFFGF